MRGGIVLALAPLGPGLRVPLDLVSSGYSSPLRALRPPAVFFHTSPASMCAIP